MNPGRWRTPEGRDLPALAELIRRASDGESWEEIATDFQLHAGKGAEAVFARYATEVDKAARRTALKRRNFNKNQPYRNRGGYLVEPGVKRERTDPWAGMGECFA